MVNVFFNVSIRNAGQFFPNACFTPVRYLFNGRAIEIVDKKVVFDSLNHPKKNWKATAVAIALLIPGLILGVIAKTLYLILYPSTRENFSIARDYFKSQSIPSTESSADHEEKSRTKNVLIAQEYVKSLPKLSSEEIKPLNEFHAELEKESEELKNQMIFPEIWDDEHFIFRMDQFMLKAYKEMELFYHQLQEKCGNDPKKMAERISRNYLTEDDKASDPTLYMFIYFYDSLTDLYHLARIGFSHKEGENASIRDEMDYQKRFFNPQMKQFGWRQLYNAFCYKLDDSGLSKHLKDQRFKEWSEPDHQLEDFIIPWVRPTRTVTVHGI